MNKKIKDFVSANAEKILDATEKELADMAVEYLEDYIGLVKAAEAEHVKNGFPVPQGQPMQSQRFHAIVRRLLRGEYVDNTAQHYEIAEIVAETQTGKAIDEYKAII